MAIRRVLSAGILGLGLGALAACGGSGPGGSSPPGSMQQPGTQPTLGQSVQGIATYYGATGAGNCSYDATPNDLMVAAMNEPQYQNSQACGMCVDVTGPKGKVTVRIVDRCPECQSGHLDLSKQAFAEIADLSAGRVNITWQPVACATSGPVAYHFKEGSNQWWAAVQVRNSRVSIRKIEAQVNGNWQNLQQQQYNYYIGENLGAGPFTLRVTSTTDQQITDSGIALKVAMDVPGTQQFP